MHLWPGHLFAATFLFQGLVAAVSASLLAGVPLPHVAPASGMSRQPLSSVLLDPRFIAAVICGAVSYMLMNFMMTAAPLATHMQAHAQESSNLSLQWHVIAMYLPSFFATPLRGWQLPAAITSIWSPHDPVQRGTGDRGGRVDAVAALVDAWRRSDRTRWPTRAALDWLRADAGGRARMGALR